MFIYYIHVWFGEIHRSFLHILTELGQLCFFSQFLGGNITCVGQEQLREVSHSGPGCVNRGGSHHPILWEDMFEKIGETDTNIYIYILIIIQ